MLSSVRVLAGEGCGQPSKEADVEISRAISKVVISDVCCSLPSISFRSIHTERAGPRLQVL